MNRRAVAIPLALYIHFPWCVEKCPYCDFNSHALRAALPAASYIEALLEDLRQQLSGPDERTVQSVFMGGGTPSLIPPREIGRLIRALREGGRLDSNAELTLEANPGTLDAAHFDAYLEAGVNRLSIGVQSFDDQQLREIGRIHNAGQALKAIDRARQAGFERINLDLMYGLPGQSMQAARQDVETAIAQDVEHLSVYQLTIEPNTAFAVRPPILPDSEHIWNMQQQAQESLRTAGYTHYEVSAYTRELPCRHNLNYWEFGDYLAIGAGAHGKLSRYDKTGRLEIHRFANHRHPKAYLEGAVDGVFASQRTEVRADSRAFEFLMNALRLRRGFELELYHERTQGDPRELLKMLGPFMRCDWLENNGSLLRATDSGFAFLDSMLLECL